MGKKCDFCGNEMDITLRSIHYSRKIEIKNVPVYSCESCNNHIILEQVKNEFKYIISKVKKEEEQMIYFEDISEIAKQLIDLYRQQDIFYSDELLNELEYLLQKAINKRQYFH